MNARQVSLEEMFMTSEDDPLFRDVAKVARAASTAPLVIGGKVLGFLVARADAVRLIRKLETTPGIVKLRIDRYRHVATGRSFDLCVEGELTSPHHSDRFPAPSDVEQLRHNPLPVIGLLDLLALKAKSARAQDEADFVTLFKERGLAAEDVARARVKLVDPRLRELVDHWHARALEEIERERLRKPPELE